MLITDARIITPALTYENGWLHVDNGKIAGIGGGNPPVIVDVEIINAEGKLCCRASLMSMYTARWGTKR